MVFRIANLVMLAGFVLAAGLQYNDPDPQIWIGVYAGAALACWFCHSRPLHWILPGFLAVCFSVMAAFFSRDIPPNQSLLASEPGRETLGLLVSTLWMLVLLWRGWNERRSKGS